VTGFGILGHTLELARGSHVQIDLIYENLPFYPNALRMYQKGETTGSNKANRKLAEGAWGIATPKTAAEQALLFDPQTSDGLFRQQESQGTMCKDLKAQGSRLKAQRKRIV
jgi:selenide,water dikinase